MGGTNYLDPAHEQAAAEQRRRLEQLLRERARRARTFPLSFSQERLWLIDQLDPGHASYIIPAAARISGPLDVEILRRSLDAVVARHEVLRTTFVVEGDRPVQHVADALKIELPLADLSALPPAEHEREIERRARAEARRPFDLARGPLLRARLLSLDAGEHVLLFTMHHIVSDGWSMGVLVHELAAMYAALEAGRPATLPELPIQYADFALWQRERLRGAELRNHLDYWVRQLAQAPVLQLPTDRPRPPVQSFNGANHRFALPGELSARVRALAAGEGCTPFMVLLAGLQALLARFSGQEDVVVGSPIANRTRRELQGLIGFFVNTLALRTDLAGDPTFRALLRRVRDVCAQAYEHQDLPFEKLVAELRPRRDLSRTPLFQVMLVLQNLPETDLRLPTGLTLRPVDFDAGTARFDLTFIVGEREGRFAGAVEYNTDLYETATAARLAEAWQALLAAATAQPDQRLSSLPVLSPGELHRVLVELNDTTTAFPSGEAAQARFEVQARACPEAIAVAGGGDHVSYAELDRRANRLAWHLRDLGVGPETLVGICLERSASTFAAILGVLKAGGAYLPLDPHYPTERLAFMVEDSRAPVLLTTRALAARLPGAAARIVMLDTAESALAGRADAAPPCAAAGERPAYAIYTSGSTGRPKGTLLAHEGLCSLAAFQKRTFGVCGTSRILQFAALSYDASVWESFMALANGATLVLADPEASPGRDLVTLLRREAITHVTLPPSVLSLLPPADLPALRALIVAGEKCSAELVARWSGRWRLFNAYGPTETTVCATIGCCEGRRGDPPIGRPIDNIRVYLLDRHLNPVPVGVAGELHVGGVGLARGYLHRPATTAEKFLPDPFGDDPGGRLYATGDLCRRLPDGEIEYVGRIDHQVKLRGFRIELGEIETALAELPGVDRALVLAREDAPGGGQLVAYVTASPGERPQIETLRSSLRERLPEFMVPAFFLVLDELPLTTSGKVDRGALPRPEATAAGRPYVAPRSPEEETLVRIWAELLGTERVGVEDDFFELGGHSLIAAQVVSRVRERFGVELPLRRLFEAPTVAGLAEAVRRAGPATATIEPVPRDGPLPLSFAQERLWFLDRLVPGTALYNMPVAARIRGPLDRRALSCTLAEIARRHEVLRTRFLDVDGRALQSIAPAIAIEVPVVDLAGLAETERERSVRRIAREEAREPFDLAHGPLLRARLVRLAEAEHVVLLTLHHIVADGWSMAVLVRELVVLYPAIAQGRPSPLPALRLQYADWAEWQRRRLAGDALQEPMQYWRRQLAELPVLELPTDRPRPAVRTFHGATRPFSVPRPLRDRLEDLGKGEGATLFMTLLAVFQVLLGRHSGQRDVAVGTPVAGRNHADVEGLIGLFVNTLVLRGDLSGDPTFLALLARVRQTCVAAFAHQELPFEKLVEALAPERDLSRESLFQVVFTLQSVPFEPLPLGRDTTLASVEIESGLAKFDLTLAVAETPQGLEGTVQYNTDLFDAATIDRLLEHFRNLLEAVAADPRRHISALPMLAQEERRRVLVDWAAPCSAPQPAVCVPRQFEAEAERSPTAPAVVSAAGVVRYGELNERASRLAQRLRARGIGPESTVGVCLPRSSEMVVAQLGVLKAGAAYLPLDPAHPPERLAFMLGDAGARGVLTRERIDGLAARGVTAIPVDADEVADGSAGRTDRAPGAAADNLAYVISTSGSSGRPKGVAVTHGALANLVAWHRREYGVTAADRATLIAAPTFDASVWELWPYLTAGASVHIPPDDVRADPDRLLAWLVAEGVTVAFLPTPLAELVLERAWPAGASLRVLLTGGDRLHRAPRRGLPCRVVNHYGPTENAVVATAGPADPDTVGPPSIGRPIANVRAYLLDGDLAPVPPGAPGELCIGGAGLARGYLRRPELTAERFIPDPFGAEPGARLYRTGDRCRWRPDGTIDFLARLDDQMKLRGFRIEPGEIEAVLVDHPGVERARVALREDVSGDRRLVAYVVPSSEPAPTVSALRDHLAAKLPDYMVPAAFVLLAELPLTPHGKVDLKALPAPDAGGGEPTARYVAPRTPVEEHLARIWAEVLGVERVGVHDGFFALGGHSLSSVRLVAEIEKQMGRRVALATFFQRPTVGQLAEMLDGADEVVPVLLPLRPGAEGRAPFYCVHQDVGLALGYLPLARAFSTDRSVYGLQAPGLQGGPPLDTVEELAARHVAAVRSAWPQGPYLLGGHSFGGYVAFEMARQLALAGHRVALVAVLDASAPGTKSRLEGGYDDATRLAENARTVERFLGVTLDIREEDLRGLPRERQLGLFVERVRAARGDGSQPSEEAALDLLLGGGTDWIERMLDTSRAATEASLRYRPTPYPGRVALFRSEQVDPRLPSAIAADPALGWGAFVTGPLEVHAVGGDHQTMIAEPHVGDLARRLEACLERAESAGA
jgi:amino acid adenylation domain-containing protein